MKDIFILDEMPTNEKNDYELVDVKDGRKRFRGTFPECYGHILNDAMTMVLSHTAADLYREEMHYAKYAITLTAKGWEIFEDGKAWNVAYTTLGEAYLTLKWIHNLTKTN